MQNDELKVRAKYTYLPRNGCYLASSKVYDEWGTGTTKKAAKESLLRAIQSIRDKEKETNNE